MNLKSQWVAYTSIVRKEVKRFMRIWSQTLLPPVITQILYFLVFGTLIGSQVNDINGISYMAFIVPGLVMMSVINSSFANVVSSFFGIKFQRSIEEIMVSPTPERVIIAGYVTGGVLRGLIVGFIVFIISIFFTAPQIHSLIFILLFVLLTGIVFALGGLLNAILAKKFDDVSIFSTFILTPLIYLGGVFYSIADLPVFFQTVSKFNPILYMIDGFRFGFYGISDVNVIFSVLMLLVFMVVLYGTNYYLLKRGIGLRT